MLPAAVTEQVTGRAFADELADRVFDPPGMTGSFAAADDPRAADLATGHQQWFGRWRPVELAYDDAGVAHILLAPDADGLGIAVVSNAGAFLAGHEAQYDIGLGLLDLLLDQQPQPSTPSAQR